MQSVHPSSLHQQRGFTLVELSVILVIIGLIVSGVLVGQALIAAAKVRKQLVQLEEFDAAMTAFQAKFYCVPGDCKADSGALNAAGDGNGLIDYDVTWSATLESALAPAQMTGQGMIAGNYVPGAVFSTTMIPTAVQGGQIMFGSTGTTNQSVLAEWGGNAPLTTAPSVSANAASAIDAKRDDGNPLTGFVRAITGGNTDPFDTTSLAGANVALGTGLPADCLTSAATGIYNLGSDFAICLLRIRING